VMEFIDGSDLKKLIRENAPLPIDLAVDLAIQICAGIGFAHNAGLVHADVKPQNVLLTSAREVKVTDFGIAQAFNRLQMTTTTTQSSEPKEQIVWGSPQYFAPEQAQGEKPSPASDVYSIGIVMFEMLTGRLPYTGGDQQELARAHINSPIPNVKDYRPEVPDALARIIYKVMSKQKRDRYRMADQLGHILVDYRNRGQQNTTVNRRVVGNEYPAPPQQNVPPPPPGGNFQRHGGSQQPSYYQPAQPQEAEPTQKYNLAPQAPAPYSPGSQQPQQTQPAVSAPSPVQQNPGYAPSSAGVAGTGGFPSGTGRSQPVSPYDVESGGFDAITIILAVLALISVACLLPLYYLVYLAYR
ncbi:MAG: protein kinase, partial [Chloroflexota bacterium]